MPSLSVIIPSRDKYNLHHSSEALRRKDPDCELIIVWDRSKGNEPLPTTANYRRVIEVDTDFIYARNVNIGIRAAGTNDVVLLNDDAVLKTERGFSRLQELWRQHSQYGILSSAVNLVGNRNQQPMGIGLRDEPEQLCFVAVFIPRTVIEYVGLLDERFTNYGHEDDDLSRRVRMAGYRLGVYDDCEVDHSRLGSTFRPNGFTDLTANREIYIRKWASVDSEPLHIHHYPQKVTAPTRKGTGSFLKTMLRRLRPERFN